MNRQLNASFIAWRFYLIVIFVLLIVSGLIARLLYLSVINQHFLQHQGDARTVRTVSSPAFRGMITDRNGYPLAASTAVYSAWVDPGEFEVDVVQLEPLSKLLEIKAPLLRHLIQLNDDKGREFVYLKRGIPPQIAKQIMSLHLPGLHLQEDSKRFYPEGEVAAHVIGFTNIDDQGEEGLELSYNKVLSGISGKKVVLKDRNGREITEIQHINDQKMGQNLTLSIDRRIQYLAYRELLEGVQKNSADSGTAIVLDVKTGEILAMVNYPSYNPNNRLSAKNDSFRNRAVTDIFEPGSTIKTFSIALALRSGLYKKESIINTAPGWWSVAGHLVKDEHNKGPMTVEQVLQYSSNVGISKIILTLPPAGLWQILHSMGFGELTGVGLPGERVGRLVNRRTWKPFALATLSFGYGVSVTPLQLAHAYATIANQGVKIPLSILKVDKPPVGERVLDENLAKEMVSILESVLQKGGTANGIHIPGYRLAGKTGTALMTGPGGYQKHHYHSSFVGIVPATHPRIVIAVVMHDPKNKIDYLMNGGFVSAPVFQKIAEGAVRVLDISPDDMASLQPKPTDSKMVV